MSSLTARYRPLAAGLALAVGASTLSLLAGPVPTAQANVTVADELYRLTGSDVLKLEGRGWGHGRGMSQYGTLGAAQLNKTADQMTAFYYPGTAKASAGNPTIRVLLKADTDNATEVFPASELKVADLAASGGAATTLPTAVGSARPTRWRAVSTSRGLHVQYYASGWKAFTLNGTTVHKGPVQFSGPTVIRLEQTPTTVNGKTTHSSRDYRGTLRAVWRSATRVDTINSLPMESYLRGVVPKESPASWPAAALQAQSIAARSYSHYKRNHIPSGQHFDICDTVMCQVYGGYALYDGAGRRTLQEADSTNKAIAATSGVVRAYQGKPIFAEFSASNGGWSTTGDFPYLKAQRDDWDGVTKSSVHAWKATVSAAQVQKRFPAVGRLLRMRVTERDGNGAWRGRVKKVVLEGVDSGGKATTVNTTGAGIYGAHQWPQNTNGMRSSWWRVIPIFTGALGAVTSTHARSTSDDPGRLLAGSRTVVVPANSVTTLKVAVRNTGNVTWPVGGAVRLGTSAPRSRSSVSKASNWLSTTRVSSVSASAPVSPGQTGTFTLPLAGNNRSVGLSKEAFEPAWDGRAWINGAPLNLTVVRVNPGVSRVAMVDRAPAAKVSLLNAPNVGTTLVVRMRNLGKDRWTVGQERLKASAATPLATSAWISSSVPPALSRNATRPSGTAVWPGEVGEWRVPISGRRKAPGTYELSLRPSTPGGTVYGPTVRSTVTVVAATFAGELLLQANPVTVPRNGFAVTWFDLKNTGNSTWPMRSNVRSVVLASSSPSKAPTCAARTFGPRCWIASLRPGPVTHNRTRPGAADVRPGEIARFSFVLAGNNRTARSARESFGVTWEYWKRISGLTVSIPYKVGP